MSGRGDARKRSAAAPGPLKLTCLELLHCNVGPSDAARAKGILKRQRMAGTVLSGRAAKLKRRADLVSRGVDDEEVLDELTAAIGLPGQVFYVNGSKGKKLPQLPDNMQVRVSLGEHDACAANRAYHAFVCLGKPDTAAGRDHALAHGWAAPQQAFALFKADIRAVFASAISALVSTAWASLFACSPCRWTVQRGRAWCRPYMWYPSSVARCSCPRICGQRHWRVSWRLRVVRGLGQCGLASRWHAASLNKVLTSGYVVWVGMGRSMHGKQHENGGKV